MAKYKFIKYPDKNNRFDRTKVIVTSDAGTISSILEDFEDFLKGCAFHPKGPLTIDEEANEHTGSLFDTLGDGKDEE